MAYKGRQDQYVPNEWTNGDVITAEKLNHIEEGVWDADGFDTILLANTTISKPEGTYITGTGGIFNGYKSLQEILNWKHIVNIVFKCSKTVFGHLTCNDKDIIACWSDHDILSAKSWTLTVFMSTLNEVKATELEIIAVVV